MTQPRGINLFLPVTRYAMQDEKFRDLLHDDLRAQNAGRDFEVARDSYNMVMTQPEATLEDVDQAVIARDKAFLDWVSTVNEVAKELVYG